MIGPEVTSVPKRNITSWSSSFSTVSKSLLVSLLLATISLMSSRDNGFPERPENPQC